MADSNHHHHHHNHTPDIDAYARLDSPIHRWDTRFKLLGLLALIVAFASVQDYRLLPLLVTITAVIYTLARLPWAALRLRLRFPSYVVAALVIFLPFITGQTILLTLGPLTIRQEGLTLGLLIAGRLFCIVTIAFIMFGTDTFIRTIAALRALRFPDIMADMVLLTYRYLFEITAFFDQMQTAARLRGFQGGAFSLNNISTTAALVGHLFIRSYEKSERVYKAMVLRGYGADTAIRRDYFQATWVDYGKTAVMLIIAITILIIDKLIF
ncbi:MAG TPA: cobalt ECF transporter T component CbiQ [Anaerolineae bacterium]|nr:cobalt ECF transporter T component CbiQ [Anaerolineae bacterium]